MAGRTPRIPVAASIAIDRLPTPPNAASITPAPTSISTPPSTPPLTPLPRDAAAGLVTDATDAARVAIPAVVGYNWFTRRVLDQEAEMRRLGSLLADLVSEEESVTVERPQRVSV